MSPADDSAGPRACCYWLFKSEPSVFSYDDLLASPDRTTRWDGVRNYQARNFLRDAVRQGDLVFFYHSSQQPMAIAGTVKVVREAYPDPTAFDPGSPCFDPTSDPDRPAWFAVDVRAVRKFPEPLIRERLASQPDLHGMLLLKKGVRLSVQPVTPAEWAFICGMAGVDPATGE